MVSTFVRLWRQIYFVLLAEAIPQDGKVKEVYPIRAAVLLCDVFDAVYEEATIGHKI